jgi:hypoxanthine phosphoribosyltransferase
MPSKSSDFRGSASIGTRLFGSRAWTYNRLSHRFSSYEKKSIVKQLLSEEQIRGGVDRLAKEIGEHYAHRPLTIIGVLTGSMVLVADLIRRIDLPLRVGVIQARSYRGAVTRPGQLEINDSMLPDIRGRDVLLVDDIFDTGHTLAALVAQISTLGPRSVRSAVLLSKLGRQEVDLRPDHAAFEIPDAFVVGYGLDYQDAYRHLPYVAVLEPHDLDSTGLASEGQE